MINYHAPTAGQYYIGVADFKQINTGQYTISWIASDNIPNNYLTTASLVRNGEVTSKLDVEYDSDWFSMKMVSGFSYGFQLRGVKGHSIQGADIQLHDAEGNILAEKEYDDFGDIEDEANLFFNAKATGDYFLSLNGNPMNSSSLSNRDNDEYTVKWIATDTVKNDITTTKALARNSSVTSTLDVNGDSDWFKVTMNAGESYGFQLLGTGTNPLKWGDLQLRDAHGNIIKLFDANRSVHPNTLSHTATETGTYFISVKDGARDTGAYVLRNLGLDNVPSNTSTKSQLVNGGQLTSRIDTPDDSDWHCFATQQGESYRFEVSGDGSAGELAHATLILRDGLGNIVGQYSGTNPHLTYLAPSSDAIHIEVRGASSSDMGDYQLSVVSDARSLYGTAGEDRLQGGSGRTTIYGNAGSDWLFGGKNVDILHGGGGRDHLFGGAHRDFLYGNRGNDSLDGGAGKDELSGGEGNDTLTGGKGKDVFQFDAGYPQVASVDRITDFEDGKDLIQIGYGPEAFPELTLTTAGTNVLIASGKLSIIVEGISLNQLMADDFLFI